LQVAQSWLKSALEKIGQVANVQLGRTGNYTSQVWINTCDTRLDTDFANA
jgi:hypothetical protein